MILIQLFFRKKYIRIFGFIFFLFAIFYCVTCYNLWQVDQIDIDNYDWYLIASTSKYQSIPIKDIRTSIPIPEEDWMENGIIDHSNDTYYKVWFSRLTDYEKYKEDAILAIDQRYQANLEYVESFYSISKFLLGIFLLLIVFTIGAVIYYEKDTIYLLSVVGYQDYQIFLIYFINLALLLFPSILLYLVVSFLLL